METKKELTEVEKKLLQKWEESPELRAEFMSDWEAFLAYESAMKAGRVRFAGTSKK
jgi:hypothetical protein